MMGKSRGLEMEIKIEQVGKRGRKSSHGRESQVERAEGVAVQLHGNWDRLWRGTVVVWVSILGEYTREIVLLSLGVSVSAQGEIEEIESWSARQTGLGFYF